MLNSTDEACGYGAFLALCSNPNRINFPAAPHSAHGMALPIAYDRGANWIPGTLRATSWVDGNPRARFGIRPPGPMRIQSVCRERRWRAAGTTLRASARLL